MPASLAGLQSPSFSIIGSIQSILSSRIVLQDSFKDNKLLVAGDARHLTKQCSKFCVIP